MKKWIATGACLALLPLSVMLAFALLKPVSGASLRLDIKNGPMWTRCYALRTGWSAYRRWYVLSPHGDVRIRDTDACIEERSNLTLVSDFGGSDTIYFNAPSCRALPDPTRKAVTDVITAAGALEGQDRSILLASLGRPTSRCDPDLNGFSCFCDLS